MAVNWGLPDAPVSWQNDTMIAPGFSPWSDASPKRWPPVSFSALPFDEAENYSTTQTKKKKKKAEQGMDLSLDPNPFGMDGDKEYPPLPFGGPHSDLVHLRTENNRLHSELAWLRDENKRLLRETKEMRQRLGLDLAF